MQGKDIKFSEVQINRPDGQTRTIKFETGRLAKQSDGCVVAYLDNDTTVLSTTTSSSSVRQDFDFFPLTVDVEERMYAAGKIPGSFFRREGKPPTSATLAARIIDRPLRPLFNKAIRNEIQIVETVLAINPEDTYDVLAINAASASTLISGIPFGGPVGAVRLAFIEGEWIPFPRWSELKNSVFEISIAGRIVGDDVAIAMIEANATENALQLLEENPKQQKPTENAIIEALETSKQYVRVLCEGQLALKDQLDIEEKVFELFESYSEDAYNLTKESIESMDSDHNLKESLFIGDKQTREEKLDEILELIVEDVKSKITFSSEEEKEEFDFDALESEVKGAYTAIQKELVRTEILTKHRRIGDRGLDQIRELHADVHVLPRVHGSAIFERGETQIMGITTLNMLKLEQMLDSLTPVDTKRYIHHYNFPPYSTGETGRVGTPKRREIGHGALAEKALVSVLPTREEFPYAIRQVSEALGSNGSTSMGSVCASTLSLLSAGVPLKAPVAGIAMGLVSGEIDGETKYVALTDILGAEDAYGDMDFKVAGTSEFVSAIQLDTKLDGIPSSALAAALEQAKKARMELLDLINNTISEPSEMNEFAPKIESFSIPVDTIGEVIGPKGKMITKIQEETGAEVTIEDDGNVFIACESKEGLEAACKMVNDIANPVLPEVGDKFDAEVVSITSFGAFLSLTISQEGLLHISQLRHLNDEQMVENVEDVVSVGDVIEVVVNAIDRDNKISLAIPGFEEENRKPRPRRNNFKKGDRKRRSNF